MGETVGYYEKSIKIGRGVGGEGQHDLRGEKLKDNVEGELEGV